MKKNKKYTKQEIDYLKKNYGKILVNKIAKKLKRRTESSIRAKAYELKLYSNLDHCPEQIKKMKEGLSKKPKISSYFPSKELAYIIGVMLGDGNLMKGKCKGLRLRVIDKDFILNFKKKLEKWSGLKTTRIYKIKDKSYVQGYIWGIMLISTKAYEFYNQFDINKNKNAFKNIDLFLNKQEYKIEFIKGFFDSEGCISTGRIAFSNTNLDLINYTQKLCNNLNIKTKIYKRKSRINRFGNKFYRSKKCYDLYTQNTKDNIQLCSIINSSIQRKQEIIKDIRELNH